MERFEQPDHIESIMNSLLTSSIDMYPAIVIPPALAETSMHNNYCLLLVCTPTSDAPQAYKASIDPTCYIQGIQADRTIRRVFTPQNLSARHGRLLPHRYDEAVWMERLRRPANLVSSPDQASSVGVPNAWHRRRAHSGGKGSLPRTVKQYKL
jgi:hypothetical protein